MLRVMHISDAYIKYLFPSAVPGKMNFSSVPEILVAYSYPYLRDIKVNNISVGYLECSHFFFTGKVLPPTTVFSMLKASFVCQGLFLCVVLGNSVCLCLGRISVSFYIHTALWRKNHLHVLQEFCVLCSSKDFSLHVCLLFFFLGSALKKSL